MVQVAQRDRNVGLTLAIFKRRPSYLIVRGEPPPDRFGFVVVPLDQVFAGYVVLPVDFGGLIRV